MKAVDIQKILEKNQKELKQILNLKINYFKNMITSKYIIKKEIENHSKKEYASIDKSEFANYELRIKENNQTELLYKDKVIKKL